MNEFFGTDMDFGETECLMSLPLALSSNWLENPALSPHPAFSPPLGPPFFSFPSCLSVRRSGWEAFNVVCDPRQSDPMAAMRDSIHPSVYSVYKQCQWTSCDPSLNTSTPREVRSMGPYILQTDIDGIPFSLRHWR